MDITQRLRQTRLSAPDINGGRRQVLLNPDGEDAAQEIERLRTAAGGEQGGEGWRDISTAPKGELILVGRLGSPEMCVFVIEDQWWDEAFESGDEPTHWQPLPKPPGG